MWWDFVRGVIAAVVVVAVIHLAKRHPRLGALLLTLPIVSILALTMSWLAYRDIGVVSRLARETLVLVPLGLVFFVPLAFAPRLGIGYWLAFWGGIAMACVVIGLWFWLGPKGW